MPGLIVHSETPFNAEPPLDRLRAGFMTPQSAFCVRSHGNVPVLSEDTHRLRIQGRIARPLDLSMRDLRDDFNRRAVMATMQCAGNRRRSAQGATCHGRSLGGGSDR
jgi:sulfite oxidase